jgi:hypothetical protein
MQQNTAFSMIAKETQDGAELRGGIRSLVPATVVVLSQTALVILIYRHTLQLAFVSDAWVYLGRLRTGVWASVATPIGYHFQPVVCAWFALIRVFFGESAAAFQAVNMAQLVLLGYLTYRLGLRLLPEAGAAFLGSLLLLGNAAFYEVTYWPLCGNAFLLAAQLYVVAVILAIDVGSGRIGRSGPWLLGATVLAAVFSHPAMITALPVCALTIYLTVTGGGNGRQQEHRRSEMVKALLPLALVGALFVLSRIAFGSYFDLAPKPSLEPMRAYWLVTRGLVAVFSLRGSHDVVHRLMTLGTTTYLPSPMIWVFVGCWLVVAAVAAVLCLWRARTPGLRVLVSFLVIHLGIGAIAGPISSRQSLVPAVPAALLTAWGLRVVAERLSKLPRPGTGGEVFRQIPAVAALLFIVAARTDHYTAAEVHARAGNLSRALVAQVKTLVPPGGRPVNLTLVNMPGYRVIRNIGAATFANGLYELVQLNSSDIATLQLCKISIPSAPLDFANESMQVSLADLRDQLLDPSRVVLLFEEPSELRVLTPERLDSLGSQ